MKIPSSVRITSKVAYEVSVCERAEPDLGYCDPNKLEIVLSPRQSRTSLEKVFFHECFHAMSFEYHINLTENQVLGLEMAFWSFLKLNGYKVVKSK